MAHDNYASSIIAKPGSNKREPQELAMEIFDITCLKITSSLIFHGFSEKVMS